MKKIIVPFVLSIMTVFSSCSNRQESDDIYAGADSFQATMAAAYYYGESSVEGCDSYGLSLFYGHVDSDYYLDGKGLELYFELLSPSSKDLALQPGTYQALVRVSGLIPSYTLATGSVSGSLINGSYLQENRSDVSEPEYLLVSDGSLVVSRRSNSYVIEARVIAAGEPIVFTYSGKVDALDCSGTEGGDTGGEGDAYTFSAFTQSELDYEGKSDDGKWTYWAIYLADNNIDLATLEGKGNLLCIELCTANASKTNVPLGEFPICDTDADMTACAIYGSDDDGWYGTMFCTDNNIEVGATSGKVTLSKNGSNYTVTADFVDEDFGTSYSGSYTGPLPYVDITAASRREPRRIERVHRLRPAANRSFK